MQDLTEMLRLVPGFMGSLGISLVFLVGYGVLEHESRHTARPTPASVQQAVDSSPQATPKTPVAQLPGGVVAGQNAQAKDSGGSNHSSAAEFWVRSLSDAESAQLESACSRLKELPAPTAYQTCLKAQLDLITNAAGQPDLSALSGVERESMESACSEAKRLRGQDGYNRCLTAQVAELAAEPERPDLSALNARDRDSIEAACRNAKYRHGPSAYNRCRVRFMKALVESR